MDGEATQFSCCLHAEFPPRLGPGSKESGSFPHYGHGPCSWLFLKEGNNFISKESLKNQQLVQTNSLVPRSSTHPCTLGCCLTSSRGTCRWSELHGVCGSAPTWLGMDAKEREYWNTQVITSNPPGHAHLSHPSPFLLHAGWHMCKGLWHFPAALRSGSQTAWSIPV